MEPVFVPAELLVAALELFVAPPEEVVEFADPAETDDVLGV